MKKLASILFTRVPLPGYTKTRLAAKEEGGFLTPEEAATFYKASLMDTIEVILKVIKSFKEEKPDVENKLFIAYEPKEQEERLWEMLEKLDMQGLSKDSIELFTTSGNDFNDRIAMSFEYVFKKGYESAVMVGGDHPLIQPRVIKEAFGHLERLENEHHRGAIVAGPCLEAGIYLVAQTSNVPVDFKDVFYNNQGITSLEVYTKKAMDRQVPFAFLELVTDVDIPSDLAALVVSVRSMDYASEFQPSLSLPRHTLEFIKKLNLCVSAPPNQRDIMLH